MTLEEIRALCNVEKVRDCRNPDLCKDLSQIDEGFIYHIDRDILNHSPERSALENIDDNLNDKDTMTEIADRYPGAERYNSYPFGAETDIVYSRFLGVCREKTKLEDVFKEAIRHSEAVMQSCPQYPERTSIIITDKWDEKTFTKYEKAFVRYACKHDIFPLFLLVTDYGYTQIPFLPNDRGKVRALTLDEDVDRSEARMLFKDLPVYYRENGGTFNIWNRDEYTFNFKDKVWNLTCAYEENRNTSGTIPAKAANSFFKDVLWIASIDDKELDIDIHSLDAARYELSVFGKRLFWDASIVDRNGDPRYIKLHNAIHKLIDSLEKND